MRPSSISKNTTPSNVIKISYELKNDTLTYPINDLQICFILPYLNKYTIVRCSLAHVNISDFFFQLYIVNYSPTIVIIGVQNAKIFAPSSERDTGKPKKKDSQN